MAQQTSSVPLIDSAVVDAKPLRTLTPMFPAPLGLQTFTPQNSPSVVCVTPFGPYAGGSELGIPSGVPPMFAAPAAPAEPRGGQPHRVNLNGAAHANGSEINSLVAPSLQTPPSAATPSLQTPLSAATPESSKRKRGRPKRAPDTTVPSAPSVPLAPTVPSVPHEAKNVVSSMPTSATLQESGKRKRGRPKRVQDPVLLTPLASQADNTPVLQTVHSSTVNESGARKRGRPKRLQDSSDTSTPTHSKDTEPTFQTPATTSSESGKRKRGRPKRVTDGSATPSDSGFPVDDDTVGAGKRGRPRKVDTNLLQIPSLLSDDPRESADNVLMMFDALRRRLMQMDEVKQVAKQQHNLKAGSIMINAELRVNKNKRIGDIPGVEVGDMFYFRIEMCLVGLNSQSMAGIDYMSARFGNEEDPVAISIVSAGVYDNTEDDLDVLVYTGQGMSGKDDQKLERGNLALERSLHRGNLIRVIHSVKDLTCPTGKIYIYDGLYKIKEAWVEKAKSGFNVFKHKLLREPGQPDGIAMWKKTEKWRENPSSRHHVILGDISYGLESKPVCLVNEVDDETGEIVDKNSANGDDDYIFETPPSEQMLKWNYAPELLGEPNLSDSNETPKQLPLIISAKRTGNIARFMNHSCSPNVFWQPVLYDHGDEGYPHVAFFAIKNIPPNDRAHI
ncbi:hypothetical protein U9M48_030854 [Paspalum notatum var. saurae]|uniref:Uncharacterized protein n=1 Tax=Paspalum notatum var. saurae TaxID=547442 RepID=A0AAQ3U1E8_PASNO